MDYQQDVEKLVQAVVQGPGELAPALRRTVAAYTRALSLEQAPDREDIPAVTAPYLDKVARHAYQVTDADMNQLKAAEYTEDELFEMTISAALGAGLARYEAGLALLAE